MSHRSPSFGSPHSALPRIAGVAGLSAVLAMVVASPVPAQTACLSHDRLVEMLDGRYSEKPVALGLEAGGRLFEVFAATDGATWTMVITTPDGASCVVAVGEEWQEPQQLAFDPEM
ncbi:MAG: hypothetical protein OEN55_03775 [Alphaproteobacteria bacterium]|nr:hypothetical protein [Alphaproteobacteria bacterium]